jgi:hypothetical protein
MMTTPTLNKSNTKAYVTEEYGQVTVVNYATGVNITTLGRRRAFAIGNFARPTERLCLFHYGETKQLPRL